MDFSIFSFFIAVFTMKSYNSKTIIAPFMPQQSKSTECTVLLHFLLAFRTINERSNQPNEATRYGFFCQQTKKKMRKKMWLAIESYVHDKWGAFDQ